MTDNERHECGHTDEEHQEQLTYLMQQLSRGDISVLVPRLSNENLELTMQAVVAEVMVRSLDLDQAVENWHQFNHLVHAIYLVPTAAESASPDHWNDIQKGREQFGREVEQYNFQSEVEEGLRKLFEGGLDESQ